MIRSVKSYTQLSHESSVIEKRCNFDGPDGLQYCFHDLRKEELCFSRHHSREVEAMVWVTFTLYRTIYLIFTDQNINGERFKTILESVFLLLVALFGAIPWIFYKIIMIRFITLE